MTEVKSNFWGKYSEDSMQKLLGENRIYEMRWEVFEDLYHRTRTELESAKKLIEQNRELQHGCNELSIENDRLRHDRDQLEFELQNARDVADIAIMENLKLKDQITLYVEPLKSLQNEIPEE